MRIAQEKVTPFRGRDGQVAGALYVLDADQVAELRESGSVTIEARVE
ncbi:hypothetical protein [Haladaptatus sp. NG-SE-30]